MPENPANQERRWDDGLVGVPRQIAEINHSPLRVLAGPGTGKTFALMRRVARLLQSGSQPERMLVCTFTRTAAADLEREIARLGIQGVDGIRTGTIHSICFRILWRAEVMALTHRTPRTLLSYEERFLLEDLKGLGFGGIQACKKRLEAFNAAWARLQTEEPGWPTDPNDRSFHQALVGWLRFHEGMLVGEIVPETLRYLRENPASNERCAFDHVLVDEYQDLNKAEQSLLDLLAEAGTLTVIGDEDQSIYSFKFAHPEGISTFHQTHTDTHDETLTDCRRCPRTVVEMANALIVNNSRAITRVLNAPTTNPYGEVYVVQWPSVEEETEGIARFVKDRVVSGQVSAGQVLVLAPRRRFGYAIRDALNSSGVRAQSFFTEEALEGNPKAINESLSQEAFASITLLGDPNDHVALRCWCGFGSDSLRRGAWRRLRNYCENSGESPRIALERLSSGEINLPYTAGLVTRFQELELRLNNLAGLLGPALLDALFPASEPWAEPFRVLAATLETDDFDARGLREVLSSGITQPELPTDADFVRIMSLHKSKGLTADLVVVVGCIEGLIPFVNTSLPLAEQQESLEEQRRLFYVAITRTSQTLVISSVTRLPRDLAFRIGAMVTGGNRTHANSVSSRFLSELGASRPTPVLGSSIIAG